MDLNRFFPLSATSLSPSSESTLTTWSWWSSMCACRWWDIALYVLYLGGSVWLQSNWVILYRLSCFLQFIIRWLHHHDFAGAFGLSLFACFQHVYLSFLHIILLPCSPIVLPCHHCCLFGQTPIHPMSCVFVRSLLLPMI